VCAKQRFCHFQALFMPLKKKACLHRKEALFDVQRRLVCIVKKACLKCEEAFFENGG